jgi:cytochrome c-type biogenesis protein CcmH/NrfF
VRALAAVLVAGLALAAPALASDQHPTQSEMEADLVCPQCHTPLDESDSPIAQQMKVQIRKWIAAGWTKSQIEDAFVAQLGPAVLGVPRTHGFDLLAWVLPFAGIALGAAALGVGAWVWSRNRGDDDALLAADGPALDPELERRVDEELARFDG